MNEYYTLDELRALGCPDGLLIQYFTFTKREIDRLICQTQSVSPMY